MTELIRTELDAGIATLTFNRASALNALNTAMAIELAERLQQLTTRLNVRAIVLTGEGRAFMAGGDVHTLRAALDLKPAERSRAIGKLVHHAQLAVKTIIGSRKPVMASVNGVAAGFGLSLAAACDVVIAADTATFTSAYNRLGTSPDGAATFTLPRTLGARQAAQWLYFDEPHSAAEAQRTGLVNWVVPAGELAAATRERAMRLAALSPSAFGETKALLSSTAKHSIEEQLIAEQRGFLAYAEHEDFRTGIEAFVARREPAFGTR
jgi:2-(1,2-epoxy-1,2-dihydrophenyl)acetyl-CoA isomerase